MQALPIVPPPIDDEILSSWIARVAASHGLRPRDLLCWIGLDQRDYRDLDLTIDRSSAWRISKAFRTAPDHLVSMTHTNLPARARPFARCGYRIYACPFCFQDDPYGKNSPILKSWSLWWARDCVSCGRKLAANDPCHIFPHVPQSSYPRINHWADQGAAILEQWATEKEHCAVAVEIPLLLRLILRFAGIQTRIHDIRFLEPSNRLRLLCGLGRLAHDPVMKIAWMRGFANSKSLEECEDILNGEPGDLIRRIDQADRFPRLRRKAARQLAHRRQLLAALIAVKRMGLLEAPKKKAETPLDKICRQAVSEALANQSSNRRPTKLSATTVLREAQRIATIQLSRAS